VYVFWHSRIRFSYGFNLFWAFWTGEIFNSMFLDIRDLMLQVGGRMLVLASAPTT